MIRTLLFLSCLAASWLLPVSALAADTQEFDYRRMYELLYQFETLPPPARDRLRFAIRLQDETGRAPPGMEVHIRYGRREIPVTVDEFGLLDLPFSPQLASINAPVVTNQPADSLRLGFTMVIRRPENRPIDIEWLLAGMQQADAAMQARARIAENLVPEVIGVTLKFAGETRGQVIIHGETDDVEYRADEYNTVDIPIDEANLPERIEITDQPLVIFPLFQG
ncbi:MAG: hypothetical protein R3270_05785 [Gammaproteobacteria bacterium]|nr:hypothetical protein [Gammaproteobacteria bacterium]